MAYATRLSFFVYNSTTNKGVTGLTSAAAFTTLKVSEDGTLGSDIKATATIVDDGAGNYGFEFTTAGNPVKELKPVPVMANSDYQAVPVIIGAESLRQLADTPVTANTTKVSGTAQTPGDINAKLTAIAGQTGQMEFVLGKIKAVTGDGAAIMPSGEAVALTSAYDAAKTAASQTSVTAIYDLIKANASGDVAAMKLILDALYEMTESV